MGDVERAGGGLESPPAPKVLIGPPADGLQGDAGLLPTRHAVALVLIVAKPVVQHVAVLLAEIADAKLR